MNLSDYLLQVGKDDDLAILTEEGQHTYGDLRDFAARIMGVLKDNAVVPSDRIGLLGANSVAWVAAYLAILKLGAVVVPLSAAAMPGEVRAQSEFAGCKLTLVQQRLAGRYQPALDGSPVLVLEDCLGASPRMAWEAYPLETEFDEGREAAIMFTSGTTQRPRAVRVSHHNVRANTNSILAYLGLSRDERIMVVLPFSYCFGTSLLHSYLRAGASLVLSNSFTFPEKVLDLMEAHHCTDFAGVPSTYQSLIKNSTLKTRRMEALRKVQQAGGKLPVAYIRELMEILPGVQIFIMYGATEATARLSYLPPAMLATKTGSIGKGIPGVELKVLNEMGEPVTPGEVGEIVARGENISMGYLNDAEATAEKFIKDTLHTGDLATVDEDGFIYIVDRKDDFIKSYGHRVSSQQVEACVLELEEVAAAAAIGEPDEVRGEAIVLFVSPRPGSALTAEEILSHCQHKLARHMVPKTIRIVDALPVGPQGKVLKSDLRKSLVNPPL